MSRRAVWCLLISLLFITNYSYGIKALPQYNVFYLPANGEIAPRPYIELYWQVDPNSVHFRVDTNDIWLGKVKTEVKVYTDTGIIANEQYYLQTTKAASLRAAQLQNIMDLHRYVVPEGKVFFELKLYEDKYEDETFTYIDSVTIEQEDAPFYSQLQLIDTSYKTDAEDNLFYKNGNLQIPLSFDFLDDPRKFLHYYFELYSTHLVEDTPLVQTIFISKKELDYTILKLSHTDTIQPATVLPVRGRFRIDVLPSGNYYLNVILKNAIGQKLTQRSLFFQRSNQDPVVLEDTTGSDSSLFEKVELFDLGETFVGEYTGPQLMAILKMIKPIATEIELPNIDAFSQKPNFTYMRYFIYNFWKAHTPSDPEQGWKDYTKRVKEVNKLFGTGAKPGYETERGYYYLKYGEPDLRWVVTAEEGAWPYEVWQYNAPGKQSSGGAFLFYSPGFMVNDYRLLHSTVQGEIFNTAWRAQLYKSGASSGNTNSRAEQVFIRR